MKMVLVCDIFSEYRDYTIYSLGLRPLSLTAETTLVDDNLPSGIVA